jgi:hypothetical protein
MKIIFSTFAFASCLLQPDAFGFALAIIKGERLTANPRLKL